MEAMRTKLRTEEGKKTYTTRMYTVEPVFADMKWNHRKIMMGLRGKVNVNGEFSLMCLVHNVKKIVKRVFEGSVDFLNTREKTTRLDKFRREPVPALAGTRA